MLVFCIVSVIINVHYQDCVQNSYSSNIAKKKEARFEWKLNRGIGWVLSRLILVRHFGWWNRRMKSFLESKKKTMFVFNDKGCVSYTKEKVKVKRKIMGRQIGRRRCRWHVTKMIGSFRTNLRQPLYFLWPQTRNALHQKSLEVNLRRKEFRLYFCKKSLRLIPLPAKRQLDGLNTCFNEIISNENEYQVHNNYKTRQLILKINWNLFHLWKVYYGYIINIFTHSKLSACARCDCISGQTRILGWIMHE